MSIKSFIDLIQILELMRNPRLQNLLYMVLVAGNFLNSVSYFFHHPVIILWIDEYKFKKKIIQPTHHLMRIKSMTKDIISKSVLF